MNGMKRAVLLGLCVLALVRGGKAQQLGVGSALPALSPAVPVITKSGTTTTVSACCGGIITTLVGTATAGSTGDGGPASSAQVSAGIRGIAADAAGDVFFADITNQTVRVVYEGGATAAGLITTENPGITPVVGNIYVLIGAEGIAGTPANGALGTTARINTATGALALDAAGDVYFFDSGTSKIWVLYAGGTNTAGTNFIAIEAGVTSPVLGHIYAIAGGSSTAGYGGNGSLATASNVQFHAVNDMKFDAVGNLYIVDNGNSCIREVNAQTGIVSLFAGVANTAGNTTLPAVATQADLNAPYGIAVSPAGDVYIADKSNSQIKVVYEGGTQAYNLIQLENPPAAGASALVPIVGDMYLIAGHGSTKTPFGVLATLGSLPQPTMVALDNAGNLYIAATYIMEININTGVMVTISGNGTTGYAGDGGLATSAEMAAVRSVAVDASGRIYITDAPNARIRQVSQGLMSFIGQPVGTTSTPELIQLTNTGSATLTFTGTPTFGGTNAGDYALDLSSSLNTCTLTTLAAGASCNLAVTYSPAAPGLTSATLSIATNDSLSPHIITLQGQLTPTTTALNSSATTSYPGGIVTLTATVASEGGTPTGTISIYQGATLLQTFTPLPASGTVTLTLPALSLGTYTYSAVYSGDNNFATSTSANLTINADSYTISATPTTLSVAPGGETPTTLTIVATGPSAQTLSLSCTAPATLGCAFFTSSSVYAAPSVTFAAGATTTITLQVAAVPTTSMRSMSHPSKAVAALLFPFGALLAYGLRGKRRSKVSLLVVLLCLGSLGVLSGCSEKSNIGTPLGASTQTVTVNVSSSGSSTSYTQSVALTVNVQ